MVIMQKPCAEEPVLSPAMLSLQQSYLLDDGGNPNGSLDSRLRRGPSSTPSFVDLGPKLLQPRKRLSQSSTERLKSILTAPSHLSVSRNKSSSRSTSNSKPKTKSKSRSSSRAQVSPLEAATTTTTSSPTCAATTASTREVLTTAIPTSASMSRLASRIPAPIDTRNLPTPTSTRSPSSLSNPARPHAILPIHKSASNAQTASHSTTPPNTHGFSTFRSHGRVSSQPSLHLMSRVGSSPSFSKKMGHPRSHVPKRSQSSATPRSSAADPLSQSLHQPRTQQFFSYYQQRHQQHNQQHQPPTTITSSRGQSAHLKRPPSLTMLAAKIKSSSNSLRSGAHTTTSDHSSSTAPNNVNSSFPKVAITNGHHYHGRLGNKISTNSNSSQGSYCSYTAPLARRSSEGGGHVRSGSGMSSSISISTRSGNSSIADSDESDHRSSPTATAGQACYTQPTKGTTSLYRTNNSIDSFASVTSSVFSSSSYIAGNASTASMNDNSNASNNAGGSNATCVVQMAQRSNASAVKSALNVLQRRCDQMRSDAHIHNHGTTSNHSDDDGDSFGGDSGQRHEIIATVPPLRECHLLSAWAVDAYYKVIISKYNGIGIVLDTMQSFPNDDHDLQATCCSILHNMGNKAMIQEKGGVEAMLEVMECCSNSIHVQSEACCALYGQALQNCLLASSQDEDTPSSGDAALTQRLQHAVQHAQDMYLTAKGKESVSYLQKYIEERESVQSETQT